MLDSHVFLKGSLLDYVRFPLFSLFDAQGFAERLYDILSHERLGAAAAAAAQQARLLSLAFGTEGRAPPGFPLKYQQYQQHYQGVGLPSPFGSTATTASCSSSPSSSSASSAGFSHLPQQQQQLPRRQDPSESVESTHRRGGEGEEERTRGGMVMSEQERQVLLARSRSGPSAASIAAAAEQDRQVLLARSRSGPASYTRDDEHRYYQQQQDAGYMYDRSPDRSPVARGGGFSFGSSRLGSGAPPGSGGGALPPLPSLNFEQYNIRGGDGGGGGGGPVSMGEMRRTPWYGPESSYAPPPIGSYVN